MNLPAKIIELIEQLPAILRAGIYYLVIEYMRTGEVNTRGIGEHAVREFYVLKPVLDRILHRRRKSREYRELRKQRAAARTALVETQCASPAPQTACNAQKPVADVGLSTPPPMSFAPRELVETSAPFAPPRQTISGLPDTMRLSKNMT